MSYIIFVEPGECLVKIDKNAASSIVYGIDVRKIIAPGDALFSASAALVTPAWQTLGSYGFSGTIILARVSAGDGTLGVEEGLRFSWDTVGGDMDQRTIYLVLQQR